jgi:hypothetical protein
VGLGLSTVDMVCVTSNLSEAPMLTSLWGLFWVTEAFFDLYIGDPPVSETAKQTIRANFARILQEKSC